MHLQVEFPSAQRKYLIYLKRDNILWFYDLKTCDSINMKTLLFHKPFKIGCLRLNLVMSIINIKCSFRYHSHSILRPCVYIRSARARDERRR